MEYKVAYAIPVAADDVERAKATFQMWDELGYITMGLFDGDDPSPAICDVTVCSPEYKGYGWAINQLSLSIPCIDWMVIGGADVYPDPDYTANRLAEECTEHFKGTYGVMQPAGDCYGAIKSRTACVSPWMGREWRRRINGGKGPLWEEYRHYYDDAELYEVATRERRLWWREDVGQFHDHWGRNNSGVPEHIARLGNRVALSRDLFNKRKALGFPGSTPLPLPI